MGKSGCTIHHDSSIYNSYKVGVFPELANYSKRNRRGTKQSEETDEFAVRNFVEFRQAAGYTINNRASKEHPFHA